MGHLFIQVLVAWLSDDLKLVQTELCQSSLQQYMEEQPVDPQMMGWPLFIDILTGLDHIHEQGFIHLDIKVVVDEQLGRSNQLTFSARQYSYRIWWALQNRRFGTDERQKPVGQFKQGLSRR